MSENRIEQYLQDEPTSCPQCERAEGFYTAAYAERERSKEYYTKAHKEMVSAVVLRLDSRQTEKVAIRLFWTSCLIFFATFATSLYVILGR